MEIQLDGGWLILFQAMLVITPLVWISLLGILSWIVKEIIALREFKVKTTGRLCSLERLVFKTSVTPKGVKAK